MSTPETTKIAGLKLKSSKIEKSPTVVGLFSSLLHSATQAHIFHLQTKSYAEHMALGAYYDSIVDLADSLIEAYQGMYGIVKGYDMARMYDYSDPCDYFKKLHKQVESSYKQFPDSDLQNILDEIKTLLKSTIYKLENLK